MAKTNLTDKQKSAIKSTNKYGVIYDIHPATAASLVARGLIDQHKNFYGQSHGWKLTSEGFDMKRRIS